MKSLYLKAKAFFKLGIERISASWKSNKKVFLKEIGKFVVYVCKIVIELFIDRRF